METTAIFVVQLVWFLVAWSTLAVVLVAPRLAGLPGETALTIALAPQMFRVLGIGLLVPALAPELPRSFAIPTAIGDVTTAVLAWAAVLALHRRSPHGRRLAWACTLVGAGDLAIALPHAARIEAARYLAAQWYVPTLAVPLMIVSHALTLRVLLGSRRP